MKNQLSANDQAYLQGLYNGINSAKREIDKLPEDHKAYFRSLHDGLVTERVESQLSSEQQAYLMGLRQGDLKGSQLLVGPQLSEQAASDLVNFQEFLKQHGHPTPTDNGLSLTIRRQAFLSMLFYADDRNRKCLILQCCFGCRESPQKTSSGDLISVGELVLIQKGNFQQLAGRSDVDLFFADSVFRNEQKELELFLNMDVTNKLSFKDAKTFIDNFIAMYPPARTLSNDPFIHGYLLPVKPLINLFMDPAWAFAQANEITIRWGITGFNLDGSLGNFTLVITPKGMEDGPAIEFRSESIEGTGAGDCPPKTGCNLTGPK